MIVSAGRPVTGLDRFRQCTAAMNVKDQLVFVVEDQPEVGRLVCRALEDHGYKTEMFGRAGDFQRRIKTRRPNLCIIDLGLPDDDGLHVIRDVQARYGIPVIIMTGRGGVVDRVLGLELGADDYVVKPFDPRELVARVNAVLRRSGRDHGSELQQSNDVAKFGGWTFDFDVHALTSPEGRRTELSAAEAQLLLAFARAPNRILSRDSLLGLKGGDERSPFDRSIDVRISRLRQKIEKDPKNPQIIKTVYGTGYMFAARVEWIAKAG
jgi:DNA-binding response OmpR family regulator